MEAAARIGASRFSPPQQDVHLVQRPSLIDALNEGLSRRLILLQAPAGYGKSTLLAQWRDVLTEQGTRIAWLTLDEGHCIAAEFLTGLILAAADIQTVVTEPALRDVTDGQHPVFSIQTLLTGLEREQGPIIFVIDDYHLAQNDQTDALLDLLVRRMPQNVHLVLASRSRPALALAQLRAQGQLCELGVEQLRFSLDESADLLRPSVNGEEIATLTARLEGWPIALQLAAVRARDHAGGTEFPHILSGAMDDMGDYLATQIFARLPDHLQTFLLEISIFDRFDSGVVDAARGSVNSALFIEELRRFDILLVPIDKKRIWWRHHHLVAEFLASRRGQLGRTRLKRMHERASAWFESRGDTLEAARHAREAGDRKRMVALIEDAGCVRLSLEKGLPRARALMALLSPAEIDDSARLRLADSLALFQEGKLKAGDRKLEQARLLVKATPLGDWEGLRSDLLVVEGLRAGYGEALLSDDNQEALEALCARNLDTDPWFGGLLNNIQCLLDLRKGEIESARLCGQKALGYFRAASSMYGCVFMNIHLGSIAITEGKLTEAGNYLQTAEDLVLSHFGDNISLFSIIRTLMAEIAYSRNNVAQAAEFLDESLPAIATSEGWPELYASGYGTSALLSFARGDSKSAEAILAAAVELLRSRALPRLNLFLMARHANILGRLGHVVEAGTILIDIEAALLPNPTVNWIARDEHALAKARLKIIGGDPDMALALLDVVVNEARRQHRTRSEIGAETLRVLALAAQGRDEDSSQTLQGVIERLRGEGERRMLIDEGPVMAERLRELVRRRGGVRLSPATLEYVADLLTGFGKLTRGDEKTRLLATLTLREREILGALVHGGSNKVIARAIGLNENAVKFHLKNVFRKLGVAGRAMAVAVAEKLELLD